jgi:hypothetical protein
MMASKSTGGSSLVGEGEGIGFLRRFPLRCLGCGLRWRVSGRLFRVSGESTERCFSKVAILSRGKPRETDHFLAEFQCGTNRSV